MANFSIDPGRVGLKALRKRINRQKLPKIAYAARIRLTRSWEAAADAFIRAAIRRVLVDTGMSAATFLPLSRAINRVRGTKAIETRIESKRKSVTKPGVPTFPSGDRRQGYQSELEGERLGKKAYIFQVPRSRKQLVFKFAFQTVAFQHAFHEHGGKMVESLETGLVAFRESIRKAFRKDGRFIIDNFIRGKAVPLQGIE